MQIDPGLVSSCDNYSYGDLLYTSNSFQRLNKLHDAYSVAQNKCNSAFESLAIFFKLPLIGEASNRFIVEGDVAKRRRITCKEENEKEVES